MGWDGSEACFGRVGGSEAVCPTRAEGPAEAPRWPEGGRVRGSCSLRRKQKKKKRIEKEIRRNAASRLIRSETIQLACVCNVWCELRPDCESRRKA
jgi:hypothetical protein